jgi:putative transcription factor
MIDMYCEMCGRNVPKLTKIRIEDTELNVCDNCLKFGKPVVENASTKPHNQDNISAVTIPVKKRPYPVPKPRTKIRVKEDIESLEPIPDFHILVRETRSKMGLTQEQLAEKILEKKNIISSIERGGYIPEIRTLRKLEKFLKIQLVEKIE